MFTCYFSKKSCSELEETKMNKKINEKKWYHTFKYPQGLKIIGDGWGARK